MHSCAHVRTKAHKRARARTHTRTPRYSPLYLVTVVLIVAHVKEGDSEGSFPAELGVGLLDITELRHQLLAGDGLAGDREGKINERLEQIRIGLA